MFGHKRIPSREGGVEIVVEKLSSGMVNRGHTVICCNRRGHHISGSEYDTQKQKQHLGVALRWMPTVDIKGLAAVSSSFFAAAYSVFSGADVVHIHAEGPAFWSWIPKMFGKKVIVTIHGLDWAREKWKSGFASRFIRWGEWMAVRCSDEIIVLSTAVQKYFGKNYKRNTVLIPNGVEVAQKLPADVISKRFGLQKDSYILFLGRLVPEKGIHYLLQAFRQTHTKKRLVIAGGVSDSGDYIDRIKQLAEADDRVLFTGFVEGAVLQELYSNSYLYVLPSDLEGMPLSLLEAMSYGNCCLVSDIPECRDVVGEAGLCFPHGDVEALRSAVQFLCDTPAEVEGYRKKAAEAVNKKYTWDSVVEETLNLYMR